MTLPPDSHTSFDSYQQLAQETDKFRGDPNGESALVLGLGGEAGKLQSWFKKRLRDGDAYTGFKSSVKEELGDILWYVSNIAARFGFSLSSIARENLEKTRARWLQPDGPFEPFDEDWPEAQQLPRQFTYRYETVVTEERERVVLVDLDDNRRQVGDPLTDNAYRADGYRYHDVIHLAFAVNLGWSPVVRKLLRRKRKNDLQKDEVDDGARAQIIEEAIAAAVYYYAEDNNFLRGATAVDWELLRMAKRLTQDLEVNVRTEADWEKAIFNAIGVWCSVNDAGGGTLRGSLRERSLVFIPDGG